MSRLMITMILATVARAQEQPLTATERQQFVGVYSVVPASGQPMPLRVFEQDSALMGQFRNNDPTHLRYEGHNRFRPAAAATFELTFTVERGHAT